jgi:DNA gyrase subunit B
MSYNESNIKVLKGLQSVRVRPGMFIGSTSSSGPNSGLNHLVLEITDNSIDESMAGYCSEINIVLFKDGETISIEDNGRGIPVALHPTEGKSTLEIVMTVLHAGGKFDGSGYEASGGLHGVGASVVNALSDYLKVEVWRDGGLYIQEYSEGIPKYDVKKVKDLTPSDKQHGTKTTFHADKTIFKGGVAFNEKTIVSRLREVAFLNKGLKITFTNEATGNTQVFQATGGISDYVKYLTEAKNSHYPVNPIYGEHKGKIDGREGVIGVEFAIQYTQEDDETIVSFANNINTVDGGTHTSGFKTALTRIVNNFAKSLELVKESKGNLSGDDIREGMTAIISVRVPQPEFVGQTKAKLGSVEVEGYVSSVVSEILTDYFNKNAAVVKKIVERAVIAQEARDAAKKASGLIKRKSFLGNNNRLPGKLSDCNSSKVEECELFLCEGDSAAGSSKMGRNSEVQAVLPIRGKIINAEKNDLSALLKNNEIQSLILAIGAGFKDQFDISKIRYNKVILLVDADDDGCHIATLLITFFYKYMRSLITEGHLYLAQPPLFKVQNGKDKKYFYDKNLMSEYSQSLGDKGKVVRYKGLGEMDSDELGETTLDPNNRQLIKVEITDLGEAERLVSILMGSNAQARKDFIVNQ